MSVLRRIRNQTSTVVPFDNYTTLPSFFGQINRTGINVSRERAMQHAGVWACIRLRAETIASLPVAVVEYQGDVRLPQDPPPWLQRPNPETTRFELFERTSASIDADGNAFWWLLRDRLNRVQEVWVLPPSSVNVYREPPKRAGDPPGPKEYKVGSEKVDAAEIVHIPGFTLPGRLRGMSPIEQHAHSIGLSIAAEEYGETFFGNGAVMSVVLSTPGADPGKPAVDRMRDSFTRDHGGVSRAHRPGFLFGGTTATQLTIPNEASQFLETRKFQLAEIARIFRVPSHKINDLDHATFSNIEHQAIEWVQDGVMPYTARIEAAVQAAGMLGIGQQLRFNFGGLLRGDTTSRYAAYAIARQWGWLSVDDIRALEDTNPLPDGQGQVYLEPMNMVPAGSARPEVAKALLAAGVDREVIANLTGVRYAEETA